MDGAGGGPEFDGLIDRSSLGEPARPDVLRGRLEHDRRRLGRIRVAVLVTVWTLAAVAVTILAVAAARAT